MLNIKSENIGSVTSTIHVVIYTSHLIAIASYCSNQLTTNHCLVCELANMQLSACANIIAVCKKLDINLFEHFRAQ